MALHFVTKKGGSPVALHSHDSSDWYTPKPVVNAARWVMNGIDLDPASHPEANVWIGAKKIYTEQDNGLVQTWGTGVESVFVNPPGGQVPQFWIKFIKEWQMMNFTQGIWIGYSLEQLQTLQVQCKGWLHPLDLTICIPRQRIAFVENEAKKAQRIEKLKKQGKTPNEKSQPSHGNYIVYVGWNPLGFKDKFTQFGRVDVR